MAVQHFNTQMEVFVRLEALHSAYVGLEVLAGADNGESSHVSAVLLFLNDALLDCVQASRPSSEVSGLRLVD